MKLLLTALAKYILGILLVGTLVFLPAGTFGYKEGWIFITILFVPILIMGLILFIKAPDLLKKRLESKEKENAQKGIVAVSGVMFIAGFIISGLDFRFGWSDIPVWLEITACIIFLLSYILYAEVMRENAYLSRTIKVDEGQQVIDKGLYSVVRHPMYCATIFLFLSIPLILGSWWSFVIFLLYPAVIVLRILNEEKILEKNLNGYSQYKQKVKFRLIPFVW